jgi:phage tail sheath gpL-like
MAASFLITINDTSDRTATDWATLKPSDTTNKLLFINNLTDYIGRVASGNTSASVKLEVSDQAVVTATGTVTCASVQAGDTVTINGVTVTAHAATTSATLFAVGASDTACGDNLVTCLKFAAQDALIARHVWPTNNGGVVTLTAKTPGHAGNAITLASSNGTRLAVSGARLTGGTGVTSDTTVLSTYTFGA